MAKVSNNGFWLIFHREVTQILNHKPTLFITIIGPLFALAITFAIFVHGIPQKLPVAIVDNDYTSISRTMCRMIDATAIADVNRSYKSLLEAQNALNKSEIDAIVYIPKGTEKRIVTGHQSDIPVYLNNSNLLTSGLLNSGLRKALITVSTGVKLKYHISKGKTYQQAYDNSLPIVLNAKILSNPFLNYTYFLVPAVMAVLMMVFTLLSAGYALGRELYHGSGKKFLSIANNKFFPAIFGKLLPYTITSFIMTMTMNIFLFKIIGMPLHGSVVIILISEALLIFSYQGIAVFLTVIFKNLRLILSIASAYIMMALTFSGLTFPLHSMPIEAKAFSQIFPFTHWLQIFFGQTMKAEPIDVPLKLLYFFIVFILLGLLSLPRLRHILDNPKYWGKE